ncbi:hypothetical protein ABVC56_11450 [Lactobacillus crispatus]|uniref:hypothetical protein n=1 Tax=Lactobacillus crispatus TaxID=47770 RepID=UPI00336A1351
MRDAITYKAGYEINDGQTGDTSVGWEDKYNALVARFVNDGTRDMSQKEISNLHSKDHAEKEAADAVLKANAEKFREIFGAIATVAKQVVDLLNSSNFPKLHKAYSFAVGTSERTPRESVDVLVSEVDFDFDESGSNQYTEQIQRLAINVFIVKKQQ